MEIAKRIKETREEKNLSQHQLAKIIGVDNSAISYWESGKNEPKASYIYKLSLALEVTSDYLLGLEDESGIKITQNINNNIIGTFNQINNIKK